jgi:hypothetical protein
MSKYGLCLKAARCERQKLSASETLTGVTGRRKEIAKMSHPTNNTDRPNKQEQPAQDDYYCPDKQHRRFLAKHRFEQARGEAQEPRE